VEALAPPTDSVGLPAWTGIDDLVVGAVTVGTAHGISSYKNEAQ
jgi:hypothetical protein